MRYEAGTPPAGASDNPRVLADWIRTELEYIARTLKEQSEVNLTPLSVEPLKPRDGMVVKADGLLWDPGAGEGVYAYYAGTWSRLG